MRRTSLSGSKPTQNAPIYEHNVVDTCEDGFTSQVASSIQTQAVPSAGIAAAVDLDGDAAIFLFPVKEQAVVREPRTRPIRREHSVFRSETLTS